MQSGGVRLISDTSRTKTLDRRPPSQIMTLEWPRPASRSDTPTPATELARFHPEPERIVDTSALVGRRFRLGRVIGSGGMSNVYSAIDMLTRNRVAVKVSLPIPEYADAIMEEAETLSRISHPNVVRFIDAGPYEDKAFLAMEMLDRARELIDLVQEGGPFPWCSVRAITTQLCDALEAVHDAGIIHGDVKPENVMVIPIPTENGPMIKLIDFGIARFMSDVVNVSDDDHNVKGTIPYMAPELLQDTRALYDPRIDTYSVGAVMYGMLTKINPFLHSGNMVRQMQHVLHHTPEHPSDVNPGVPRAVGELVMRMICKNPEDRSDSPAELRDVIQSHP